MLKLPSALILVTSLITSHSAYAAGDPENGEKVFRKCAACHTADPAAKSKTGPSLYGVVGRITGTLEGFKYSPAMIKAGEEGHVWTVEELDLFLTNPKAMIKGHKMSFAGLKKEDERADVIAYLQANGPAATDAAGADAPEAKAEAEAGADAAPEAAPAP